MRKFIFHLNNIVKYFEHLPPFGKNQGLPDDKIIKLINFVLPCEWHKHLLIQGFNSVSNILNELVEFCYLLNTSVYIFYNKGDGTQQKKTNQSSEI